MDYLMISLMIALCVFVALFGGSLVFIYWKEVYSKEKKHQQRRQSLYHPAKKPRRRAWRIALNCAKFSALVIVIIMLYSHLWLQTGGQ